MKNSLILPDIGLNPAALNIEAERQFVVDSEVSIWIDVYCTSINHISQAQIQSKHVQKFLGHPHISPLLSENTQYRVQQLLGNGEKMNIRVRTTINESGEQAGIFTIKPNRRILAENSSGVPSLVFRTRTETLKRLNGWKIRGEYDFPLDFEVANELIDDIITANNDSTKIEKRRYTICHMQHEIWYVDVYEGKNTGIIRAEQEVFLQKTPDGTLVLPPQSGGKYIPNRGTPMYDITNAATHPGIELSGKSLQSYPFTEWSEGEKEKYQQLVQKGFIKK